MQAEIVVLELLAAQNLQNPLMRPLPHPATAYGMGSVDPASRNTRSRKTQLSQTPQATFSPE
jgi:hypothetical protein